MAGLLQGVQSLVARLDAVLRRPHHQSTVLLAVCAFIAVTGNRAFWSAVLDSVAPLDTTDLPLLASVALAQGVVLLLALGIAAQGPLFRPVLIAALFIAATCAHFMDRYSVIIDHGMIDNVLQTDPGEALALIGPALMRDLLLFGLLPSLLVLRAGLRPQPLWRRLLGRAALLAGALLLLLLVVLPQYKTLSFWGRMHRDVRLYLNPTYPVYALSSRLADRFGSNEPVVIEKVGEDARSTLGPPPLTVVLVVGETARADHFQINGYPRPTTPRLAQREDLVSFTDVSSCGTYTGYSLPCMFSRLDREQMDVDRAERQETVLDVLQRAGVAVRWLDNDSGCKGVCERVPYRAVTRDATGADCPVWGCYDSELLRLWDEEGSARPASRHELIVLHPRGSHGPAYYRRLPPEQAVFLPSCERDDLGNCTVDEIVNAYDNTIVYTDWFLDEVIRRLEARGGDAVMLYVSDHGESLGESGVFLHGLPYALAPREQVHVPMVLWMSPGASRRIAPAWNACRDEIAQRPASHDHLFDTLLGLFRVLSRDYRPGMDLLADCRTEARD